MKLHKDGNEQFILTSDDIISSGNNIGKKLTSIIDEHSHDINDLKKYTKWLYKYGGTGSKGGSYPSPDAPGSASLSYQIFLANVKVNPNETIILGDKIENDKSVPLEIVLSNVNVSNKYEIRSLTVNGGSDLSGKKAFTIDNDFRLRYTLDLSKNNKGNIALLIRSIPESGSITNESISINYINKAYLFTTDIVNDQGNTLFLNNETIFYSNSINNGVNLKINYECQTDADIIVESSSNILSNNRFILNEIYKTEGSILIPFANDFISSEDIIGDYTIPLSFFVNGICIYQQNVSFTIVPADDVFIKIKPIIDIAQLYKFKELDDNIIDSYNEFDKYYTLYNKLNTTKTLTQDEIDDIVSHFNIDTSNFTEENFNDELKAALYSELNNYKYYVFSTGNIGFKLSPYMPMNISESNLYYTLGKYEASSNSIEFENDVNLGYITATQKNKVFNINIIERGIYVLCVYTTDTKNKIYYYFYAYDKDSTFNWYRNNIENIFNINKNYLHYYRTGNTTEVFNKYKSSQYIQTYSNSSDINVCNFNAINSNDMTYDCFVSIGVQYSHINDNHTFKSAKPIITIGSIDASLKIDIYQDKITMGENKNSISFFLPKESNYDPSKNENYHLISLYKRFIYYNGSPHYEICVYLDGVLEGALGAFSLSSSVWNSIVLHNANYSINLMEIAYLPHSADYTTDSTGNIVYLDDIAISEYHYKYANEYNNESLAINEVKDILNALRSFKETDYGMIEAESSDTIKEISKSINIPIIVFEYNETANGSEEFVSTFFQTAQQESTKKRWNLQNVYYAHGAQELDLNRDDCKILIDGNGQWYIETQGSSTMQYLVKNLTLGITSNQDGVIYLFTPNFKYANDNTAQSVEAARTYLPEQSFTLKGDLVDSSHSNNTAIGKFVNNNTKKFDINFNVHSVYHKYIKNCLIGFPVLTFIKVNSIETDENNNEILITHIYFLGIYNFNLGRDSYFNMGYYDPLLLEQNNDGYIHNILKECDGNKFITVPFELMGDEKELKTSDSVIVAEIQGNSGYADFSQYDSSILLPDINIIDGEGNIKDDAAMFGDFVPKLDKNSQNKILWHLQRLVKNVSEGGGYIFDYVLKKHFGLHSYAYSRYIAPSIYDSANQVPMYRVQFKRNELADEDKTYLINTNNYDSIFNALNNYDTDQYKINLKNSLTNLIFNQDDNTGSIKESILDYPSLAEYYTICMAFGLTDSVQKNLNVKTWNASWSNDYINQNNVTDVHGKWFVAFYDMDTAFGRYNNGDYLDYSYFAFSDYWNANEETLTSPTIYRDFKPSSTNDEKVKIEGFDIPSSYLFAVAKYAAIAFDNDGTTNPNGSSLNTGNDAFQMYVPNNIWAKYRNIPSSETNVLYTGLNGLGELRNAEYFIDNYFSKELNNIPEQLWNMNYRFKYLKRITFDVNVPHSYKQSTTYGGSFIAKELQSFHGRGIYQVKDWMNYRLHMLDTYFNVDQTITDIKYLAYENNYSIVAKNDSNGNLVGYTYEDNSTIVRNQNQNPQWLPTNYYDICPVGSDLLKTNKDVVILQDVFSPNGDGNRYTLIDLQVKALEYSPLIIIPKEKVKQRKYLLINPEVWYNVSYSNQNAGTDQIILGGSGLWVDLKSANTLIASKALNIYSNQIKTLNVTNGICDTWNISEMSSLNEIYIVKSDADTISNFSGSISSSEDQHPDLTKITLDRTNILLNLINVKSIKEVNYLRSTGNVNLTGCVNLESVKLTSSNINNCTIKPAWSNNISITDIGTKITSLSLSPKDVNNDSSSITIKGISTLKTVNLENFKYIHIENCPLLEEININNANEIKSIKIIKCGNDIYSSDDNNCINICNNSYSYISNVDENNILDLNEFINLTEISLNNTPGINVIDAQSIPGYKYTFDNGNEYDVIKLAPRAFYGTHVKTIYTSENTYLLIDDAGTNVTATFGASYFGDSSIDNSMNIKVIVPKYITSLSGLFNNSDISSVRKGSIGLIACANILGNGTGYPQFIYENKDNIVNLSYMFRNQNISLSNHDQCEQISLASFKNVSNISNIFGYNNVQYLSSVLFENNGQILGSNVNEITVTDFATQFDKIELNALAPIINKIKNLDFSTWAIDIAALYDDNGNLIDSEYFDAKNIFNGISDDNILESISGINISSNVNVNWDGLFVKYDESNNKVARFPRINRIDRSFIHKNKNDIGFNGELGIGIEYINESTEIKNSLCFDNVNSLVDFNVFDHFNNWNKTIYNSESALNMYKQLDEDKIVEILNNYNDANILKLDYIFNKTTILTNSETYYALKLSDDSNTPYKFTSMSHAFEDMKCKNKTTDVEIPILIDTASLHCMNKVTNWSYSFKNVNLYNNLPLNMFNLKSNTGDYVVGSYSKIISNMEHMFENVKISNQSWFAHENYDIDITQYNSVLDGSYSSEIDTAEMNIKLLNPRSVDKTILGTNVKYGENIKTHLILPFDIFYGCVGNCNIQYCFANAQFEGIMPDKLFKGTEINNNDGAYFANTFLNLLVIPNKIGDYTYEVLDSSGQPKTPQSIPTYLFIPSEFTKINNLMEAFNFKILLPNSINSNTETSIKEAYSLFNYDSFGEYVNGEFKNYIGSISTLVDGLPGTSDNFLSYVISNTLLERYDSSLNNYSFNPTAYYNLFYFMMMPNMDDINANEYGLKILNRFNLGFKYESSLTFKQTLQERGNIFNYYIMTILYGSLMTFKDEDSNFQQFNISKMLDSKESGGAAFINIHSGTVKGYDLNSENINVEKVYNKMGVAKFAILPNLGTTDEKWKYAINIVTNLSTEKLLLTNLNFETSNGLDMYRTMYDGKIK